MGKSKPVTVLPSFEIGSLSTPSPHPTSSTIKPFPAMLIMSRNVWILAWFSGLAYETAVLC